MSEQLTPDRIRPLLEKLQSVTEEPQICQEYRSRYSDGFTGTHGPLTIEEAIDFAMQSPWGKIIAEGNAVVVEYRSSGSDSGSAIWKTSSGFYLHKWWDYKD